MPFKSEKQRRFLWAEHPEIAKKWADKYPDSNKNLPMYASDKNNKSTAKEKTAQINISEFVRRLAINSSFTVHSILDPETGPNVKIADSKQEKVDIPRSEKPTYAGEEREKGMISSSIDTGKNVDGCQGENAINTLLQKISVVLAPAIEQTMENMNAEREGRVPVRVGKNRGLKQYPVATPQIPLPMGMSQAPAQPQQPQQSKQSQPASPTPVGAGQSSATTDPIKFHSGLSASGIINGNASLSAPNTVNTKISAADEQSSSLLEAPPAWLRSLMGAGLFGRMGIRGGILAGGLAGAGHGMVANPGEYIDDKGQRQKRTRLQKVVLDSLSGIGIGGLGGGVLGAAGGATVPLWPNKKEAAAGDYIQSWLTGMDHIEPETMLDILAEERVKSAVEKWAAIGLWDRIRAKKQRGEKPANPGDKDYPDSKSWKKVTGISEKSSASSPAWQRAAGKNEEGGLNAKGRASYNRATGGNLKAPVTESNPTGERNKRQNSFCSRMCGMKQHETGRKTKSDPDSRINKALRKWNCKCGSVNSMLETIKNTPNLLAGNEVGFANTFANPVVKNVAWTAAGLSPFPILGGALYAANKTPVKPDKPNKSNRPKFKKKTVRKPAVKEADLKDVLFNIRRQLPGIHTPDIVGGTLGGAGLGALYDLIKRRGDTEKQDDEKTRGRRRLNRVLTGALAGGAGTNLVGDRVRRHITNTLVPFSYTKRMSNIMPTSLKNLWRSAILDKPTYRDDALSGTATKRNNFRSLEELAVRREIMRRAFGVHTNNPLKDYLQKNKGGYYSLNEKSPNYAHNLRMLMGPIINEPYNRLRADPMNPARGIGIYDYATNPEKTLRQLNDADMIADKHKELGVFPADRYSYNSLHDLFSSLQIVGGQQMPYKKNPDGSFSVQSLDRYDLTTSKQENKHLRSYLANLFNSRWKKAPLASKVDYMTPGKWTNEDAGKSLLSRWLYDNVLSQEMPWISQKAVISPVSAARQTELNATPLSASDRPFVWPDGVGGVTNVPRPVNVTQNALPFSFQFLRENNTAAGPLMDSVKSMEDWANTRPYTPNMTPESAAAFTNWSG